MNNIFDFFGTWPDTLSINTCKTQQKVQDLAGYAQWPDTLTLEPDTLSFEPDTLTLLAGYAQALAGYAQVCGRIRSHLAGYAQAYPAFQVAGYAHMQMFLSFERLACTGHLPERIQLGRIRSSRKAWDTLMGLSPPEQDTDVTLKL